MLVLIWSQLLLLHQFNYLEDLLYSGGLAAEAGLRVSSYLSGGLRLRNYHAVDRGIINLAHGFRFLRALSTVTKISPAWFVRTSILETSLQNSPSHKSFCLLLKGARNNLFCSSHLVLVRRNLYSRSSLESLISLDLLSLVPTRLDVVLELGSIVTIVCITFSQPTCESFVATWRNTIIELTYRKKNCYVLLKDQLWRFLIY